MTTPTPSQPQPKQHADVTMHIDRFKAKATAADGAWWTALAAAGGVYAETGEVWASAAIIIAWLVQNGVVRVQAVRAMQAYSQDALLMFSHADDEGGGIPMWVNPDFTPEDN